MNGREKTMGERAKMTDVYWIGMGGGFPETLLWDKLHHMRSKTLTLLYYVISKLMFEKC